MNRFLARIITGIILAFLAGITLLHIFTTFFWGNIFKDPTWYPIKNTVELVQYIIEKTPQEKIAQEINYLSKAIDRPLEIVSADNVVLSDIVKQKISGGQVVFASSKNGKKEFFAPVNNCSSVVLIEPDFQKYRENKKLLSFTMTSILTMAAALIIMLMLTRPLVHRLNDLESAAKKIRKGDVAARVRVISGDLIGFVEKCFNGMADRLQTQIETRQVLLSDIQQKFKIPILQTDKLFVKCCHNTSDLELKNIIQKIGFVIKDIAHLVDELLRQEEKRQLRSVSANVTPMTDEKYGISRARIQKQADLKTGSKFANMPPALKTSVVKFVLRISAGIFSVMLINQALLYATPQISGKFFDVDPSWYPVNTMATLIQRAVDIATEEELPTTLESLQKRLNNRLYLVPADESKRLFSITSEKEFDEGIVYGILNGRKVFNAPIHSGKYNLIIENPRLLYLFSPNLYYHLMVLAVWFVLTGFFGTIISMPIIRNLKKLLIGIEKLRMGDLSGRVDIAPKRPIGALAHHFNSMAEYIQLLIENQRDLIQAVVHEIRTPLSRIRFHLEMLMETEKREEMNREAEDIKKEFDELKLLLKELSTFMEFDVIKDKLEVENVVLQNVLDEVVSCYRRANHSIRINFPDEINEKIMMCVHPIYFKMAISNLISNALRYSHCSVNIRYGHEKDGIFIEVCDDGPGIPNHAKKIVLEPFARLDGSRNRDSGGFGLGLSIVNRILQLHGGSVMICENLPHGAKVKTRWPIPHPC